MYKAFFLVAVLALCSLPSQCSANLIVDDFSKTARNVKIRVGDNVVRRSVAGNVSITENEGFTYFGRMNLGLVHYRVLGRRNNFGTLSSDFSNGVTFSESSSSARSNFIVGLFADRSFLGANRITSGPMFFNYDVSGAKRLTFATFGLGRRHATATLGGSLSAIPSPSVVGTPEPTSLMLFGLAVSGVAFRRRRRS